MAVEGAGGALLLDVTQLAVGRELPVAADDAAACERFKSEEPDQTHGVHVLPGPGRASDMPLGFAPTRIGLESGKAGIARLSVGAGQS